MFIVHPSLCQGWRVGVVSVPVFREVALQLGRRETEKSTLSLEQNIILEKADSFTLFLWPTFWRKSSTTILDHVFTLGADSFSANASTMDPYPAKKVFGLSLACLRSGLKDRQDLDSYQRDIGSS
jgi:hypothetical protein